MTTDQYEQYPELYLYPVDASCVCLASAHSGSENLHIFCYPLKVLSALQAQCHTWQVHLQKMSSIFFIATFSVARKS